MARPENVKVARSAKTGAFTVKREGHAQSVHSVGKETPRTVNASISKNRDALKRLANR